MTTYKEYLEKTKEIGSVQQVLFPLVYVTGLPSVVSGEKVIFETGEFGEVRFIYREVVEIMVFSDHLIRSGTGVARTGETLSVGVGPELLGQVVNPLGESLTPSGVPLTFKEFRPIDKMPPGIEKRASINRPLETGVTSVDLLVPLGRGQRELVIGDRKTGKSSFVLQSVVSQAKLGTVCIYAAIGKKRSDIKRIQEYFTEAGIMSKIIILVASSHDPGSLIYLTPFSSMTIAEYFMEKGQDVLLVYDDLSFHARYCRELSLLARKFPGRDSYPVDIFYTHARIMERAGNFKIKDKEVSISVLPIAETVNGDLSGYIQTNIMSMTDGHIYFDADMFAKGRRPAVNPFLSVTRVGHQAQSPVMREISRELVAFLANYEKLLNYVHFGAELTESVKEILAKGEQMIVLLDQGQRGVTSMEIAAFVFGVLWSGKWKGKSPFEVKGDIEVLVAKWTSDEKFAGAIGRAVTESKNLSQLVETVKTFEEIQGPKVVKESVQVVAVEPDSVGAKPQ